MGQNHGFFCVSTPVKPEENTPEVDFLKGLEKQKRWPYICRSSKMVTMRTHDQGFEQS